MTYNFTAQDVLDKVIEIGNRFPDYSYRSPNDGLDTCRYTDGADGQGCIVGQALRALGVPRDVLVPYDRGEWITRITRYGRNPSWGHRHGYH